MIIKKLSKYSIEALTWLLTFIIVATVIVGVCVATSQYWWAWCTVVVVPVAVVVAQTVVLAIYVKGISIGKEYNTYG